MPRWGDANQRKLEAVHLTPAQAELLLRLANLSQERSKLNITQAEIDELLHKGMMLCKPGERFHPSAAGVEWASQEYHRRLVGK